MIPKTFSIFFLAVSTLMQAGAPQHLVFTYMGDPSTSLTANWQWIGEERGDEALVQYDIVSRADNPDAYASEAMGTVFAIPGLKDRVMARVQLHNLKPDTTYYLRVGQAGKEFSKEVKVRTIPADDQPLCFVTGGDMGTSQDVRTLLKHAASYNPQFSAVGGDIAYANGKLDSVGDWDTWLTYYTEEMVTADGYTIPLLLAVGNHEVRGGFEKTTSEAPFFFGFFGQDPDQSFFKRTFGSNLVLFALDSGHTTSHDSQVDWLNRELTASKDIRYKAAIYHVPLYPSHRDFMGYYSRLGRQHWESVFDAHGLTVAFENHDHTFKRSHFMKGGKKVAEGEGTLYLGDGCWGRSARTISLETPWYLEKQGAIKHFWVVDVAPDHMTYRAVDIENRVFDIYPGSEAEIESASKILASIPSTYKIPDDILLSDLDLRQTENWKGGKLETKISNPFDHPVEIWFQAYSHQNLLTAKGLPDFPLKLAPGEDRVLSIEWSPKEGDAVLVENVGLSFNVQAKVHDPKLEEPVLFAGKISVKILKP